MLFCVVLVFIVTACAQQELFDVNCSAFVQLNDETDVAVPANPMLRIFRRNETSSAEWRLSTATVTVCFEASTTGAHAAAVGSLLVNITAQTLVLAGFNGTANFSAGLDISQVRATTLLLSRLAISAQLALPSVANVTLHDVAVTNAPSRPVELNVADGCEITNALVADVDLRIVATASQAIVRIRDSRFVAGRLTVDLGSNSTRSAIDIQRVNAAALSLRLAGGDVRLSQVASNYTALYRIAASRLALTDVLLSRSSLFRDFGARVAFAADFSAALLIADELEGVNVDDYVLVYESVAARNVTIQRDCRRGSTGPPLFINGNTFANGSYAQEVNYAIEGLVAPICSFKCPFVRQVSRDNGLTCAVCPDGQMGSPDDRRCVPCPDNDCRLLTKCRRGFVYNSTRDACAFCGDALVWNGVSCDCPEGTIDQPGSEWANYHGVRVCIDATPTFSAGQVAALAVGLLAVGCSVSAAITWHLVRKRMAVNKS
jgi:hypothetical protein